MRYWLFIICISLFPTLLPAQTLKVGAERTDQYISILLGKKVGLVVNQTSQINGVHLIDFLIDKNFSVTKIFAPEHGFRGDADPGQLIDDQTDSKTGLPVISLYGDNRKPTSGQMQNVDIIIFDIQDVGVRFYTYLSTMHYVMEACAENNVPLIILDRPNRNGDYVAGPLLKEEYSSFVGMHPIPVVHGCTLGEMAMMINGEGWLENHITCDLTVIPVENYTHQTHYSLPVKPSPNLPNDVAVRLYPSLCFFEATTVSIGRGTNVPFQVIGYPDTDFGDFNFMPVSIPGMSTNPIQEGNTCYGEDLRNSDLSNTFSLHYFLKYYMMFPDEEDFLSSTSWFNLLAGTDQLLKDIRDGKSLEEIEASWGDDLKSYREMRQKYLLYPDESVIK